MALVLAANGGMVIMPFIAMAPLKTIVVARADLLRHGHNELGFVDILGTLGTLFVK